MTLLALLVLLFFVVLVVCGLFVHVYLYSHGAFSEKIGHGSKRGLSTVSLRQTAIIPTTGAAADLYVKR